MYIHGATVDDEGNIHLAWASRETRDISTNHDLGYARSTDAGRTWGKSTGERYRLPITATTAEYAWEAPKNSSLINRTSITTDDKTNPYITNYWNEDGAPNSRLDI